jgi:hypothetical protein
MLILEGKSIYVLYRKYFIHSIFRQVVTNELDSIIASRVNLITCSNHLHLESPSIGLIMIFHTIIFRRCIYHHFMSLVIMRTTVKFQRSPYEGPHVDLREQKAKNTNMGRFNLVFRVAE